jgi:hypothetical protein
MIPVSDVVPLIPVADPGSFYRHSPASACLLLSSMVSRYCLHYKYFVTAVDIAIFRETHKYRESMVLLFCVVYSHSVDLLGHLLSDILHLSNLATLDIQTSCNSGLQQYVYIHDQANRTCRTSVFMVPAALA